MNPPLPRARGLARALLPAAVVLGAALHAYTMVFKADGGFTVFKLGLFAWSLAPYALAAALGWRAIHPGVAAGYAIGALVGDAFMHHAVFIQPKGSTAALGLLFMPLWNLLLLGPVGALAAWLLLRLSRRRGDGSG